MVRRSASVLRLGGSDDVAGEDLELAMVLGGLHDPGWLAGGKPPGHGYWARAWAARALLYRVAGVGDRPGRRRTHR